MASLSYFCCNSDCDLSVRIESVSDMVKLPRAKLEQYGKINNPFLYGDWSVTADRNSLPRDLRARTADETRKIELLSPARFDKRLSGGRDQRSECRKQRSPVMAVRRRQNCGRCSYPAGLDNRNSSGGLGHVVHGLIVRTNGIRRSGAQCGAVLIARSRFVIVIGFFFSADKTTKQLCSVSVPW